MASGVAPQEPAFQPKNEKDHQVPDLPPEERWMLQALKEAEAAMAEAETPVGAVIVTDSDGYVRARAHHQTRALNDPTAHAAMIALTQLVESDAETIGMPPEAGPAPKVPGPMTIVLTQEPCVMCAGAILLHSAIHRVIYGVPKRTLGACGTAVDVFTRVKTGRTVQVVGGVLLEPCRLLLERHSET